MDGTVRFSEGDPGQVALPPIRIGLGPAALTPRLRLVSSPDFLNADVGDLAPRTGPLEPPADRPTASTATTAVPSTRFSTTGRRPIPTASSWPATWSTAAGVGTARGTGNLGPVRALPQQQRALDRAAATYYAQWLKRFRQHGLDIFPAVGDHEYGDNPWPAAKRVLVPRFRERFADHFTRTRNGKHKYPDHPKGPHAFTAYAGRPLPNVQVITLDPFDITRDRARIGLDPAQRTWLRKVLAKAKHDKVKWIIVQGHVPILGPVRHPWLEPAAPDGRRRLGRLEALREVRRRPLPRRRGSRRDGAGEGRGHPDRPRRACSSSGSPTRCCSTSTTTSSTSPSATTTSGTATPPTARGCGRPSARACPCTSRSATIRSDSAPACWPRTGCGSASGLLRPGL